MIGVGVPEVYAAIVKRCAPVMSVAKSAAIVMIGIAGAAYLTTTPTTTKLEEQHVSDDTFSGGVVSCRYPMDYRRTRLPRECVASQPHQAGLVRRHPECGSGRDILHSSKES